MRKFAAMSLAGFVAGACAGGNFVRAAEDEARAGTAEQQPVTGSRGAMTKQPTTLGAFSVSLAVKDIQASRAFYEKLDFEVVMGDAAQNWLILRNGNVTLGLFQGMYDRNLLTFNPGWDDKAQPVEPFTDVREHQRRLKSKGLQPTKEADEKGTGPAGFMLTDPDGNPILVDQHVSSEPRAPQKSK
jgi:lactoylglutathione lyase